MIYSEYDNSLEHFGIKSYCADDYKIITSVGTDHMLMELKYTTIRCLNVHVAVDLTVKYFHAQGVSLHVIFDYAYGMP